MNDGSQYNERYFLRGQELGISGYTDYHWLPELTKPMACAIIASAGISPVHTILDFGCARGYLVKAFRELGYDAWGHDISRWALENADEAVKEYLVCNESTLWGNSFDWVIAKDVLEHVEAVADTITTLLTLARVGVFAVVPLGSADGCPYVVPSYEEDVTHIHRKTLATWGGLFARPGWTVELSYRVPGVKDNYSQYAAGNGFLTCRRMK